MNNLVIDSTSLTVDQRRLLGGWRDILDDIRHLCKSLKGMPDGCTCSDGPSHLSGSCTCCQTAHTDRVPACENCDRLLAALRPEMDTLTVDTMRFFPTIRDLLTPRQEGAKQGVTEASERHGASVAREAAADAIARHIAAVNQIFEDLVAAAEDFRSGCRASHLGTLKTATTDLLAEVDRLDHAL